MTSRLLRRRPAAFAAILRRPLGVTSTACCSTSFFSTTTKSSSTSSTGRSSSDTNTLIARTLYRQLLRWCKKIGGEVPLTNIPPVTLTPPRIDATSLKELASVPTNENGEYVYDATTDTDDASSSPSSPLAYLHGLLPRDAIIDNNMMIVPIQYAMPDLSGLIRVVYRLNASDAADPAHIKDRITLGFETMRSLNELSVAINEIKQSRAVHSDRTGVKFHVGQVVRHKSDNWRGVVVGWRRGGPQQPQCGPGGGTSLTTKEYGSTSTTETGGKETDGIIRYDLIVDSGDSHMLGGQTSRSVDKESGFPTASQNKLEAVEDKLLKRIRSHWMSSKFARFDVRNGCFVPDDVVRYEYPVDGVVEAKDDNDKTPLPSDEIAKEVVEGVRDFAGHLYRCVLEMTPCPEVRSGTVLWSLRQKLSAISSGTLHEPTAVASLVANSKMSMRELATMHLRSLLEICLEVSEMSWQRHIAMQDKDKIRFPLGSIVRHKKYDFRGVVVAWDPKPTVDVSRWDGLQGIKNPQEQSFFHVIPDANDCVAAFGAERPFRYVIDENLEPCPKNRCIIDVPSLDTAEWVLDTKKWRYEAPDILKFKYAESLGKDEDEIVSAVEFVKKECAKLHLASRDGGLAASDPLYSMASALSLDKLLLLLHDSDNLNDAATIEEWCKEVWKAHPDEEVRRKLDDGVADLLRGNKEKAIATFTELVEDEPDYAEAYNKKSTCHYMLGQMSMSNEAARAALHLAPTNFQALNGLGLVQYETRRYELAADSFRRSLQLDPWGPISTRLAACKDLLEEMHAVAKDNADGGDIDEEDGVSEGSAPYEK